MSNKKKTFTNINDFYNYIKRPLEENDIKNYYLINGVKKELIILINDFIYSLSDNVYSTYLGDEYIKSKEDLAKHFDWCYNKVISDFQKENLDFSKNLQIKDYFYQYFLISFYNKPEITDTNTKDVIDFDSQQYPVEINWHKSSWDKIFTFNYRKSESDLDVLLELYRLFDSCIERKI